MLFVYMLFTILYSSLFMLRVGRRKTAVVKSGKISYLALIKTPTLMYLIFCVVWGLFVFFVKDPDLIKGDWVSAFVFGVVFLGSFFALVAIYKLVWLLILGKENVVYLGAKSNEVSHA